MDLPITKGHRYEVTDSRVMGMATPWYRKGETFMKSSIPCSYGGRVHSHEKEKRRWRMQRQTPSTETRQKGRG
ncbi:hypothetical protein BHE74_00003942 [Ensete ventricosum]|nr:hypothetical protein GW17_00024709 [Ensete ventricosum]RWW87244.1 hypothetical protein BHE74_00003942 [Ensete ventricosum]RZR87603.1 hypothetical protein BHM03_00015055 [Ensete ventricosum]